MGDCRLEKSAPLQRDEKPRVLVTGFGPFGEHSINASWEAVKQLRTFSDLNELVDLITVEIPVKYCEVAALVPDLWKKYNPDLMIHCGVSGLLAWKNAIQIERHAHCHGYCRPDVDAKTPEQGFCAVDDGEKCITTGVNLDGLETWLGASEDSDCPGEEKKHRLTCQMSNDAGRFLCEFIYYTSLRINQDSTLFIHVPPLYKPFTANELAVPIKTVILKVLEWKRLIVMPAPPEKMPFATDVPHLLLDLDVVPALI